MGHGEMLGTVAHENCTKVAVDKKSPLASCGLTSACARNSHMRKTCRSGSKTKIKTQAELQAGL